MKNDWEIKSKTGSRRERKCEKAYGTKKKVESNINGFIYFKQQQQFMSSFILFLEARIRMKEKRWANAHQCIDSWFNMLYFFRTIFIYIRFGDTNERLNFKLMLNKKNSIWERKQSVKLKLKLVEKSDSTEETGQDRKCCINIYSDTTLDGPINNNIEVTEVKIVAYWHIRNKQRESEREGDSLALVCVCAHIRRQTEFIHQQKPNWSVVDKERQKQQHNKIT